MKNGFDLKYLGVMFDMAGCPNRCRHCWLGNHRNGQMSINEFRDIASQFKAWRDENGQSIKEMGFFSWWREPDFRDDYRELWELEKELSSPGRSERFELLSTWRLARDESYAVWAAGLLPKKCQITFFGMEENTDWGMRRKGAFKDQLSATERCLAVGIAPRWQLFITKRNTQNELDEFLKLMKSLNLYERCMSLGQEFEFFIGGISPEGSGYEIEDLRIELNDLPMIPREMISLNSDGKNFGIPETRLLANLLRDDNPPDISVKRPCLAIDADYNVYPNIAEPTEWWKLGNLKADGVDRIMGIYNNCATPGMTANRTIKTSEFARLYGNPKSQKLYTKNDLICRFLHQWGADYIKGAGKA